MLGAQKPRWTAPRRSSSATAARRATGPSTRWPAYEPGHRQGANYIEPDLVLTKDGVMIARHEPMLDGTTDVASKFGVDRKTHPHGRWREPPPPTSPKTSPWPRSRPCAPGRARRPRHAYNGLYEIPTLDEVIALAKARRLEPAARSASTPRSSIPPSMPVAVRRQRVRGQAGQHAARRLRQHRRRAGVHPVLRGANLQYLNGQTDIKLVQLVDADDVNADGSMSLVAPYDSPTTLPPAATPAPLPTC
jgi:glycerophosphoryl diester phosphodiesterase